MPNVPRSAKPIFRVDLFPPRSLSRRAARNIVLFLAGLITTIGFIFWSVGAWPVIGFLGLDVVLLSLAFYFSFRSARQEERIELAHGNLRVTRISVRGERQEFDFQPYWLRVVLERGEDEQATLSCAHMAKVWKLHVFWAQMKRRAWRSSLRLSCVRPVVIPPIFRSECAGLNVLQPGYETN